MLPSALVRRVLVLAVLMGNGCLRAQPYPCSDDAQCVTRSGEHGRCDEGFCSFAGSTGTLSTSTTSTSTSTSTSSTSSTTTQAGDTTGEDSTTSFASSSSSSSGDSDMPQPLSWWPLDETMGTLAQDAGPEMAHALVQGGEQPNWVPGRIGGALELDGTNDLVQVGKSTAHTLDEAFTLAAWIYVIAPSPTPHPSIIDKGNNYRLRLETTTTRASVAFRDEESPAANTSGNVTCAAEEDLPLEEWHHIAATYSVADAWLRVYVDGALAQECDAMGGQLEPHMEDPVRLGYWAGGGGAWFNGRIDDVRIYDIVLTQEQIQTLADM
jgi:hypothetical protein